MGGQDELALLRLHHLIAITLGSSCNHAEPLEPSLVKDSTFVPVHFLLVGLTLKGDVPTAGSAVVCEVLGLQAILRLQVDVGTMQPHEDMEIPAIFW